MLQRIRDSGEKKELPALPVINEKNKGVVRAEYDLFRHLIVIGTDDFSTGCSSGFDPLLIHVDSRLACDGSFPSVSTCQ